MTDWNDIVSVISGYAEHTQSEPRAQRQVILSSILSALKNDKKAQEVFYTPKSQFTVLPGTEQRTDLSITRVILSPLILVYSALRNVLLLPILHLCSLGARIATAVMALPSMAIGLVMSPLLVLLHVIFTASSVVLRVVQAQPKSDAELTKDAPDHVALILVPGQLGLHESTERYVESVRRAVLWAAEWGVKTLTVWDDQGLGIRLHQMVTDSLLDLPPSPPSSGAPSPRTSSDLGPSPHTGDETVSASVYVNASEYKSFFSIF